MFPDELLEQNSHELYFRILQIFLARYFSHLSTNQYIKLNFQKP